MDFVEVYQPSIRPRNWILSVLLLLGDNTMTDSNFKEKRIHMAYNYRGLESLMARMTWQHSVAAGQQEQQRKQRATAGNGTKL